jgi:porphobilinogen synthase
MAFPTTRMRRMRGSERLRGLACETKLDPGDFIYPLFVCPGKGVKNEISSMPGCYQMSADMIAKECEEVEGLGIPGVILFGIPEKKDAVGSEGYAPTGVVPTAIREIKDRVPGLLVVADVCLCEYTDHGHCGMIRDGGVDNDPSLELLSKAALCYAEAGADVVAPSDMMDGRVAHMRKSLDTAGKQETVILSYAVKYASAFYGPFRDAAESAPQFGDRRAYQMDPPNAREALREAALDVEEGADMIMVKPALPYLDILYRVKQASPVPVGAYNVSGEFSMIHAAAANDWLDLKRTSHESLIAIKRAGADFILTYFAKDVARDLQS